MLSAFKSLGIHPPSPQLSVHSLFAFMTCFIYYIDFMTEEKVGGMIFGEYPYLTAFVIWVVLEIIRSIIQIFTKKMNISMEYRKEVVRKRCAAYEELSIHLGQYQGAIITFNSSEAVRIFANMAKYEFYLSHKVLFKWAELGAKGRNAMQLHSEGKIKEWLALVGGFAEDVRDLSYQLKKEVYDGKIESDWVRKPSIEEVLAENPESMKYLNNMVKKLDDPEIKTIHDLLKLDDPEIKTIKDLMK